MQSFKAYVGFVDGKLHTENVIDDRGEFVGLTVYKDWSGAATRYDDVREVELRIGARRVQIEGDRRMTDEIRELLAECRTAS